MRPYYDYRLQIAGKLPTTKQYLASRFMNCYQWRGLHQIEPKLIQSLHRYQCNAMNCKRFIFYSEEVGLWFHWAPRG